MKRILLTVLAIMLCLTIFSGCSSNQYKGHLSCISRFGNDGTEIALMDMTEDAHKTILSMLNTGKWQDGVTNCGYDFEFTTKNETIRYHSECGTFIDITNNRSLSLSGKDRLSINTILGVIDNSENEENQKPQGSANDEISYGTFIVLEVSESNILVAEIGADGTAIETQHYSVPNWFNPSTNIKIDDKIGIYHNGEVLETYPMQFAEIYEMQYTDSDGCIISMIPQE